MPPIIPQKKCNGCQQEKLLTPEYWYRDRSKSDGFLTICKDCRNKSAKAYSDAHIEEIRQRSREWREDNCEHHREYSKDWRQNNRDKKNATRREARANHPEKERARSLITRMVKRGELPNVKTLKCIECEQPAKEYHHPDYERPDYVIPLCQKCHRKAHRIN